MGMQNQYTSSLTDKYLGKIRMKNFFSVSHLPEKKSWRIFYFHFLVCKEIDDSIASIY